MIKTMNVFLLIIMMFFTLLGCSKEGFSEGEISEKVKTSLQEKYDVEFVVLSVAEEDTGTNFAKPYYVARCKDAKGIGPFGVSIEADGTALRDNYEGYLYKYEIDAELQEIPSSIDSISCMSNYHAGYTLAEEKSGSFRDYVKSGHVMLIGDFSVDTASVRKAADAAFSLIDSLQKKGYGFSMHMYWGSGSVIFVRFGNDALMTIQDVECAMNV